MEGYKYLQPNSNNTNQAVLFHISKQLSAISNGVGVDAIVLSDTPSFKPPLNSVLFNAFWFISLALSLSCALTATLVQQWARQYVQAIERRPAPHKRARIRAYLYEGVVQFKMVTLVESIPALLHISVFFFLVGLVEFLLPINLAVAIVTLAITVICAALYFATTLLPSLYRNCPYRTPFSGLCWQLLQRLHLIGYYHNAWRKYILIEGDMAQGREFLAMDALPDRNTRDKVALRETLDAITEHSELEPFVEGIPGFIRSNEVSDGRSMFQDLLLDRSVKLESRIARLLMTCKATGDLPYHDMERRALACLSAIFSLTKEAPSVPSLWIACFGEHTTYVLQAFRYSDSQVIAHHACCTAALVVNKLHIDISDTLASKDLTTVQKGLPMGMPMMHNLDRGIYSLQFLDAMHSLEVGVAVEGVDADGKPLRWTRLLEDIRKRLLTAASNPTELRQIQQRGRIQALIEYVRNLMTFPALVDDLAGLSVTQDTLRAVTTDLVTRYAGQESEQHLVQLLAQVVGVEGRSGDEGASGQLKLPANVIDVFLRVFAALEDPEARQEARRVVRCYLEIEPGSTTAKRILHKIMDPVA